MIIKELRRHQTAIAIKNYLVAYLSAIGFESFSDFYGTESDPKSFTIRFKNHPKMQIQLSDDPGKSNNFTFSLYLFKDGANHEYVNFYFCKGFISPKKYVIKHRFQEAQCILEQTILFQANEILITLKSSFSYYDVDFPTNFSVESSSNMEILKKTLGFTLPHAGHIACQTTQVIDEPALESHCGPNIIVSIIALKEGIAF